jgi:hypothetical protein
MNTVQLSAMLPHDAAQMLIESAVIDAQLGIKHRSMAPCAEA